MDFDVVIVGAGLSGLACAKRLRSEGVSFAVIEGSDRIGGRVTTDEHEGFLLDRGFQILLSSYPEARQVLDLEGLRAGSFSPGSLVQRASKSWRVVDPWRAPVRGIKTLRAPFVSLGDAAHMACLRRDAKIGRDVPEETCAEMLTRRGFSGPMQKAFLRPFLAGVTLDPNLYVPSWYVLQLFRWFATGDALLPAGGMRALPEQLAAGLPEESIRLDSRVASVGSEGVELESGQSVQARAVVLATDAATTGRLLGRDPAPAWSGTTTLYFAAERSPVGEPILVLNGEGAADGPVNHLCVLSDAQPDYAPAGAALVSVSVLGVPIEDDAKLEAEVRRQLGRWYGSEVSRWRHLRTDRIARALPRAFSRETRIERQEGIFVCGDHVASPSIQGALESGRLAAEATLEQLPLQLR